LRDETTLTPTTVYVEPLAVSSLSDEPDRVTAVFAEVLNSLPYYNDRAKSAELAKYVGLSSLSDREFYQPNPNSSSNEVFGTHRTTRCSNLYPAGTKKPSGQRTGLNICGGLWFSL